MEIIGIYHEAYGILCSYSWNRSDDGVGMLKFLIRLDNFLDLLVKLGDSLVELRNEVLSGVGKQLRQGRSHSASQR